MLSKNNKIALLFFISSGISATLGVIFSIICLLLLAISLLIICFTIVIKNNNIPSWMFDIAMFLLLIGAILVFHEITNIENENSNGKIMR